MNGHPWFPHTVPDPTGPSPAAERERQTLYRHLVAAHGLDIPAWAGVVLLEYWHRLEHDTQDEGLE